MQSVSAEHKPEKKEVLYSEEKEPDQWDALLDRSTLWGTSAWLHGLCDSFTTHSSRDITPKRGLVRWSQRRWIMQETIRWKRRRRKWSRPSNSKIPAGNWEQKKLPVFLSVTVEFLVTNRDTLKGESSPTSLYAMSTKTWRPLDTTSASKGEKGDKWLQGMQGVQCTTVWTGGNGSFAVVPNRGRTTVRDYRDRLRCTHKISKKE